MIQEEARLRVNLALKRSEVLRNEVKSHSGKGFNGPVVLTGSQKASLSKAYLNVKSIKFFGEQDLSHVLRSKFDQSRSALRERIEMAADDCGCG